MTLRQAVAHLRRELGQLEAWRARLRMLHASLPAAPQELDTEDFEVHPEGMSGLRIAIEGLLSDFIDPAIRVLRAALDRAQGKKEPNE